MGINYRAAYSAADEQHSLVLVELGGITQRTHEVLDVIAVFKLRNLTRGVAYHLDKQGDLSRIGIVIAYSERHALAMLVHAYNYELSGIAMRSYILSLERHFDNRGSGYLRPYNLIHNLPSLKNLQ